MPTPSEVGHAATDVEQYFEQVPASVQQKKRKKEQTK